MTLADWWRILNAALAGVALLLVLHDFRHFAEFPRRVMFIAMGLAGLLVSAVIGSVEQAIQHTPMGVRLPFVTSALIWIIVAFVLVSDDND